uniref:Uncharacterized protein n=1 Tax=Anopheles merus TaxID=30066 RepID=A0A182UV32_ANOME
MRLSTSRASQLNESETFKDKEVIYSSTIGTKFYKFDGAGERSQRQGSSHHHRNGGVTAEDHLITIGPAVLPLKPSHHHPNGGVTAADHLITIGSAVLPLKTVASSSERRCDH